MSSARDMARYLAAQLNEEGLGSAVLSGEGIAEMHRGTARQGDSDVSYAMGWNVGQIDGVKAVWHGGDTFAYQSFMMLLPDDGWGIALLSNLSNIPANQRFQEVAMNVARLLTGRPPQSEHVHTSDWTHAVFVGAFLLQLLGITRTVQLVRRWRAIPASRPSARIWRFMRVAVPATTNLAFGLFVLVGIPALFAPLSVLTWAVPDIGHLLVLGGGIALIWSVARTILVYRVLVSRA
jgi:CubicO group peptidase (beta-lactamase class C family)